jgi:hypothetical protein
MINGKGYHVYPEVEVLSTAPCLDGAPQMFPSLEQRTSNLCVSHGIVGALIRRGLMVLDFENEDWHKEYKLAVLTAAEVMNNDEMRG